MEITEREEDSRNKEEQASIHIVDVLAQFIHGISIKYNQWFHTE